MLKKTINIPKTMLWDILNIYEHCDEKDKEQIQKHMEKLHHFDCSKQANLIVSDTEDARLECLWSDIFEIRKKIKSALTYPLIISYDIDGRVQYMDEKGIQKRSYIAQFVKDFPHKAQEATVGNYNSRKKFIKYYGR